MQADKTNVATEIPFWGCPVMSFEAQLPFYGVREDFAASERDPNRPFCSDNEFFQKSKLRQKIKELTGSEFGIQGMQICRKSEPLNTHSVGVEIQKTNGYINLWQ